MKTKTIRDPELVLPLVSHHGLCYGPETREVQNRAGEYLRRVQGPRFYHYEVSFGQWLSEGELRWAAVDCDEWLLDRKAEPLQEPYGDFFLLQRGKGNYELWSVEATAETCGNGFLRKRLPQRWAKPDYRHWGWYLPARKRERSGLRTFMQIFDMAGVPLPVPDPEPELKHKADPIKALP